ncbi:type III polyketide synthase [Balneolales bacterium ANBcel1]|nr:type III polyketide synthase [Balneolales bacterium ANBcel1]
MAVHIHRIETSVPDTFYRQSFASELMQNIPWRRAGTKRILRNIYQQSGIEKRHSVITDFNGSATSPLFFNRDGSPAPPPDTQTRNEWYTREARRLFLRLGDQLLRNSPGFNKEDVTHVITVSCTGFFAPGPDYYVVRELGLRDSVQRYHIGFMGCYAAFQGLKMADSFCRSNPDAVVLVLCVELCTLHLQFSEDTDAIISASVFADGGSGALVSARNPSDIRRMTSQDGHNPLPKSLNDDDSPTGLPDSGQSQDITLEMLDFQCSITPEGEEDMAWTIGNQGFLMRLSTYVPDIIRKNIGPALTSILKSADLKSGDIARWAVHPGGRAILDKVRDALQLPDEQLSDSRAVLRDYGNMSSATILFVLKRMMEDTSLQANRTVFAMAFGPGLTIESGLFRTRQISNRESQQNRQNKEVPKAVKS